MRQKATVIETTGDSCEIARVRVLRSSMCEGCENRSNGKSCACSLMLGSAREMIAEADNSIGAQIGDDVEIETDSETVLGYAALVFLLPIFGALLFYFVGQRFFSFPYASVVCTSVGFVISFLPAFIVDRNNRKKAPRIRIVSVDRSETSRLEE